MLDRLVQKRNKIRILCALLLLVNSVPALFALWTFAPKLITDQPLYVAALLAFYFALIAVTLVGGSIALWLMVCGNRPRSLSHG